MNSELTKKLLKRFPVLYQDYNSPMQQTCMCWGFECGDGWSDILWQLGLVIEEELDYTWSQKKVFLLKKRIAQRWNNFVYRLSPVGTKDFLARFIERIQPQSTLSEKFKRRWYLLGKYWAWWSGGLKKPWWPYTGLAVDQVKEKFGSLRYYCNGNEAIQNFIRLAERLSEVTCETCGKFGRTRDDQGWYYTSCDEHRHGEPAKRKRS